MVAFRGRAMWALVALAAAPGALASALAIKGTKLSVSAPGADDKSYVLRDPEPLATPVELGEHGVLKLAFTVFDTAKGVGAQPPQAQVLLEDVAGVTEDVVMPVSVKSNGKASYTLNLAKAPAALLASRGTFHASLVLSQPGLTPVRYRFADVHLPASALAPLPRTRHALPPRAGEPAFQPEQELFHTFRPDERSVPAAISFVGTAAVLAPWAVLLALWATLTPQFAKIRPELVVRAPSLSAYAFLACLGGLEALILAYWVGWRLYQFLPPFLGLSLVSAYVGTLALRGMRTQRLKVGSK